MKTLKDAFRHTKRETKHSLFKNVPNLTLKGNQFVVPSPNHLQNLITYPNLQPDLPAADRNIVGEEYQTFRTNNSHRRTMTITRPKFGPQDDQKYRSSSSFVSMPRQAKAYQATYHSDFFRKDQPSSMIIRPKTKKLEKRNMFEQERENETKLLLEKNTILTSFKTMHETEGAG